MSDSSWKESLSDLEAKTAADLMTANPLSIRESATVKEAVAFLVDRAISGAPVIDTAGRPVGVLTQTDILVHDREKAEYMAPEHELVEAGSALGRRLREDFLLEQADPTPVGDLMTPTVFSVTLETPASKVIGQMLALKVHRLFVVDGNGVLVGVISSLDILRCLPHRE